MSVQTSYIKVAIRLYYIIMTKMTITYIDAELLLNPGFNTN